MESSYLVISTPSHNLLARRNGPTMGKPTDFVQNFCLDLQKIQYFIAFQSLQTILEFQKLASKNSSIDSA